MLHIVGLPSDPHTVEDDAEVTGGCRLLSLNHGLRLIPGLSQGQRQLLVSPCQDVAGERKARPRVKSTPHRVEKILNSPTPDRKGCIYPKY
jgi:hypothetical protein